MKNNNFDFLRFCFSLIVVIGHLIILSGVKSIQFLGPFFNTYISVTSFFCISGYLITSSYLNTKFLRDYFSKRAARLLPAYFVTITGAAFCFSILSSLSFHEYFVHIQLYKYLLANLTFLNFIQPCLPGVFENNNVMCTVNGALWTIKVEVAFYLSIPVIIFFINKVKRKYIAFILIYILSVLYKRYFESLSESSGNGFYLMIARQLPGFMSYFISGIALYYYFDCFQKNKKWLFIFSLLIFALEFKLGWEVFRPLSLAIIIFTIAYSFKYLNNFAKYGDISYGIYIFHFPIIQTIIHFGFFNKHNPNLIVFCTITIILIVGFMSWHIIEKPFLKRAKSARI